MLNGATFTYGAVINAALSFIVIAAVIYYLVVAPAARLTALAQRNKAATDRPCPECTSTIPVAARRCMYCTAEVAPIPRPPTCPRRAAHGTATWRPNSSARCAHVSRSERVSFVARVAGVDDVAPELHQPWAHGIEPGTFLPQGPEEAGFHEPLEIPGRCLLTDDVVAGIFKVRAVCSVSYAKPRCGIEQNGHDPLWQGR